MDAIRSRTAGTANACVNTTFNFSIIGAGVPAGVRATLEAACDKAVHTQAYQDAAANRRR